MQVMRGAGEVNGWCWLLSENVIVYSVLLLTPRKCSFLYFSHWWWFWTPACQRSVTNGHCVYWFAPIRVMPCAALRCTRERDKWERRGNKTSFCLDKGLFHPPNGLLIKYLFPWNEFLEGISIWPSKQVHKGRATSCKHMVRINCLYDLRNYSQGLWECFWTWRMFWEDSVFFMHRH